MSMGNNNVGSNKKGICARLARIIPSRNKAAGMTPQPVMDDSSWDNHRLNRGPNHPNNAIPKQEKVLTRKATLKLEPKDGKGRESGEKPKSDGSFSDYIERAGSRIRGTSGGGPRKPSIRRDSFNNRVLGYIDRAKRKFHDAPSFGYNGEEVDRRKAGWRSFDMTSIF